MSVYDRIAASAPVNRQAAMSASKGEHFKPAVSFTQVMHASSPPLRAVPVHLEDLTGVTYGRLRVIGLREKERHTRWVCRCACGNHVERSSKSVKARVDGECPECGYTRKMREGLLRGMKNNPKEYRP